MRWRLVDKLSYLKEAKRDLIGIHLMNLRNTLSYTQKEDSILLSSTKISLSFQMIKH